MYAGSDYLYDLIKRHSPVEAITLPQLTCFMIDVCAYVRANSISHQAFLSGTCTHLKSISFRSLLNGKFFKLAFINLLMKKLWGNKREVPFTYFRDV